MSSNRTISIGFKLQDDGKGGFKQLVIDAKSLEKAMQANVTATEELHRKFINFATISTGIDSVGKSISSLQGIVKDLMAAYSVQSEAETKLERVMRNTMDARTEDIQSIKDFCSAQQEIGVVGDEVQLAGAQELATYLSLKSSLKSLIPVMNDMIVQQYGLEHSGENAAQIATMLGKVMNGQTGALSRYGYTFDAAQEKILKYGTEAERVAVLVDVVSQSVGGMNASMAQTDAGKLKQTANTLGDMKERLGEFAKHVAVPLEYAANLTIFAGGVMKSVSAVRTLKASIMSLKSVTSAVAALSALSGIMAPMVAITAALGAGIVMTAKGLSSLSEKSGSAAMEMQRLNESLRMAKDLAEAENEARKAAVSSLESNIARLKEFSGSKAEEKKVVTEMNNTYGRTMGYFKSVSEWYEALIRNSKAYCDQMVAEAKIRKLASQIADLEIERDSVTKDEFGNTRKYSNETKTRKTGMQVNSEGIPVPTFENYSELSDAQAKVDNLSKRIAALKGNAQGAAKALASIKMPSMGNSDIDDENNKPLSSDKKKDEVKALEGSIAKVKEDISDIDKKVIFAIDPDEIMKLESQKLELQNKLRDLELPIRIVTTREEFEKKLKGMAPEAIPIKVEMEFSGSEVPDLINVDNIEDSGSRLKKLNSDLGKSSALATQAASAFSGLGDAFEIPALDAAGIVAGALATIIQSYATALLQSASLGPLGWIGFGLSGLGTLGTMVSQIKGMKAFANGGIVSGPTMALVGEYSGASSNPEVIAPLDKLQDMIGGTGDALVIIPDVKIKGSDLYLSFNNQRKISAKSGKR